MKMNNDIVVIGTLEIIGYCNQENLIKARESVKRYNKNSDKYIYAVIRNPKGKDYGYYLIREKKLD